MAAAWDAYICSSPPASKSVTVSATSEAPPIAILLAAGVGRRLGDAAAGGPKVLLEFGGRTLLERHLAALEANGIEDIVVTVGHEADAIAAELERLGVSDRVRLTPNPAYRRGSLVSLWTQRDRMRTGSPVILMDGDVLYDARMIARLLEGEAEGAILVDRELEPGDEPVKVCFVGDAIVDFRKLPEHAHDRHGESVGFFRFSPALAADLADRCDDYVTRDVLDVEYEEAIRDLILDQPHRFGAVDVTDLPWTEIDFEEDVHKAASVILPQLQD